MEDHQITQLLDQIKNEPEQIAPGEPAEPTMEKPEEKAAEPPKGSKGKKLPILIGLVAILLIGALTGYTLWQQHQAEEQARLALEEQERAAAEEAERLAQEEAAAQEWANSKEGRLEKVQEAAAEAMADPEMKYFSWNMDWGTNAVVEGQYYFAAVNRKAGVVTIYVAEEGSDTYNIPVRAMLCSGGEDTIISKPGTAFTTSHKYRWRALAGNVYGQYCTRIEGPYLFHSVPYYSPSEADLEYPEFNKLGTTASMGCIRMAIADTKWIYDNCPLGMPVVIYDDDVPGPLGKPGRLTIDEENVFLRGWDPTDIHEANPYRLEEGWEETSGGTAVEAHTELIRYGLGAEDPLGPMWG